MLTSVSTWKRHMTRPHTPNLHGWLRPQLTFGWAHFILIIIQVCAQWVVYESIHLAGWSPHSRVLMSAAVCGVLLTSFVIWWFNSDSLTTYITLFVMGMAFIVWQLEGAVLAAVTAELGAAYTPQLSGYGDTLSEIAMHIIRWWRRIIAGEPANDPILYIAVLALISYVVVMLNTWLLLHQHQPWLSVVLSAIPLFVNYTFAGQQKSETALLLFVAMAMLSILFHHITMSDAIWRASRVDRPVTAPLQTLWNALLIVVPTLIIANAIPLPTPNETALRIWSALRSPVSTVRSGWDQAFGSGATNVAGGFSKSGMQVGGGRNQTELEVLRYQSSMPEYLRAMVFDRYTGQGWTLTNERISEALPTGTTIINSNNARQVVNSTITLSRDRSDDLLMTLGDPVAYNRDATVFALPELGVGSTGVLYLTSDIPLLATSTYTQTSHISRVYDSELRGASIATASIRAHYTVLPETVPARVGELARQLAREANATTDYDVAMAIQQYLRTFRYDEQRPRPPTSRDWVDYFVYEGQIGYCDDFATAMTVMLRTQGIPARYVQGYTGGDRDPSRGDYVVRESMAHSWVEVFFDGYGWQRFEPTPAGYTRVIDRSAPSDANRDITPVPTMVRPDDPLNQDDLDGNLERFEPPIDEQSSAADATGFQVPWYALITIFFGVILVYAGWIAWHRTPHIRRAHWMYTALISLYQFVGFSVSRSTTPLELDELTTDELPAITTSVSAFCHAYNQAFFANRPPATWPALPWHMLCWHLLRWRIQQRWGY
ncbi:MAG: transglutaminase family protein [Chloroflexi bacterium]|nr:transglutaminase family protein [Chloroflexota bacterium]